MKCPTPAELAELAEQEPSPELLDHLEACADCSALWRQLSEDLDLISELTNILSEPERAADAQPEWEAPPGMRIERVHHRGGQGIVFRATELRSGKPIALKMLPEGSYASSRQERRFEREIELASELVHPHIVRIYGAGKTRRGRLYLSMEFIDGQNVEAHMIAVRNTPTIDTVDEALRIFEQTCEAVEHAHRHGVIHRDLKPDNVLVDREGHVRVLDFGMARLVQASSSLTLSGQFLGSLPWAAPEQVQTGGEVDVRTDVHALGLLLYLLLTGESPFGRPTSVADTVRAIETRARIRPSKVAPELEIDRDLDAIVGKALEKDPADRYPSVTELLRDARAHRSGQPVSASSMGTWLRMRRGVTRHPWLTTAVVGAFGLLLAFAIVRDAQSVGAAHELARSTIARARLETHTGYETSAEQRLWSGDIDVGARARRSAEQDLKWMHLWAMRELYVEHAWIQATQAPFEGDVLLVAAGDDIILHSEASSRIEVRRSDDLSLVRTVETGAEGLPRAAVAPQLDRIACRSKDGLVYEVDLSTGLTEVLDVGVFAHALEYSWSGDLFVGSSNGRIFRLTDGSTLDLGSPLGPTRISNLNRVPSSTHLTVTGLNGRTASLSGEPDEWELGPSISHGRLIFDRNGGRAAHFTGDKVQLLSVPSFEPIWLFPLAITGDNGMAFDPKTGNLAATGADRNRVVLLGPERGEQVRTLGGHRARLTDVAYSKDGARLITVDASGLLRARQLDRSPALEAPDWSDGPPNDTTHSVAVHPPSQTIALAGGWGIAVRVKNEPFRRVLCDEFVPSVALTVDGAVVAVTYSGRVLRWAGAHAQEPEVLFSHPGGASSIAVRADGFIATAGAGGAVRFWDPGSRGVLEYDDPQVDRFSSITWTPGGQVVAGQRDGALARIDPATCTANKFEDAHTASVRCLSASPDGSLLASGGSDRAVLIWAMDGTLLHRLEDHGADVYAVAFDPEGAVLASADRSGRVRIWDPRGGRELAEVQLSDAPIFSLAFARGGRELWLGGERSTLLTWNLDDTDQLIESCRDLFAPR